MAPPTSQGSPAVTICPLFSLTPRQGQVIEQSLAPMSLFILGPLPEAAFCLHIQIYQEGSSGFLWQATSSTEPLAISPGRREQVAPCWILLYLFWAPSPLTDLEVFTCLSPPLNNQLLKVTNDKLVISIYHVMLRCVPCQKSLNEQSNGGELMSTWGRRGLSLF